MGIKIIHYKRESISLSAWAEKHGVRLTTACHRWAYYFGEQTCITAASARKLLKDRRKKCVKK